MEEYRKKYLDVDQEGQEGEGSSGSEGEVNCCRLLLSLLLVVCMEYYRACVIMIPRW